MHNLLLYCIIYPIAAASLLAVMTGLTSRRLPSSWLWAITAAGVLASLVRLIFLDYSGTWGVDHRIFWRVGADVWAGIDPYSPERYRTHPFLNPPSTFPFFALIAALPYRTSLVLWGLIGTALAFVMVPLADATLEADEGVRKPISPAELGTVATAFALSDACMATLQLGQLSLIAAAFILFAVYVRSRARPASAGVVLGLATMKVGTMIPFLLLFLRPRDWKSWLVLGLTVVGLIVLGGQALQAPDHARAMLHHIGELSKPGAVNDISYAGPYNEWILGIDHLAYRLGVRDSLCLKLIQPVALAIIGTWLAAEILTRRIPSGLGISLVSLYSLVFLYHRLYDAVIIAPALVYSIRRARATSGRARWLFAIAVVLMFSILYLRRGPMARLTDWAASHQGPAAKLTEWFVLPFPTWSVLLAMLCLRLGHTLSAEPPDGRSAPGIDPDDGGRTRS